VARPSIKSGDAADVDINDGAPTAADVCHVRVSTEFENNFKILFKEKVVNHADDDKMQNLSDKVY